MPETELQVKVGVEGIGDGEELTVDLRVAETVGEMIAQNLANRYEHIDDPEDVDVMLLKPPNRVAIHHNPEDEDSAD